jgi:hypothetical protein
VGGAGGLILINRLEGGAPALETMRSRVGRAGGLILINRLEGGAPMSLKEQHKFAFLIGLSFSSQGWGFCG